MLDSTQLPIKFSGRVAHLGKDTFEIELWYGSPTESSTLPYQKITCLNTGKIISSESSFQHEYSYGTTNAIPTSQVMQSLDILNANTIKTVCKSLGESLDADAGQFVISTTNKIKWNKIASTNNAIHSFYMSTKYPQRPTKRQIPRFLKLKDIPRTQKSNIPRNMKYAEFAGNDDSFRKAPGISFMNANTLGSYLSAQSDQPYKSLITNFLTNQLKVPQNTPVLYQSICIANNESNLLGNHGAGYIIKEPAFFLQELQTLKELMNVHKFSKIKLTIPHVKSPEQIRQVKDLIRKTGLTRSPHFQLYITLQLPGNIITLPELLDEGVDGVIYDYHAMARTILGMHSQLLEKNNIYNDRSLLKGLELVRDQTQQRKIPLYIYARDKEVEKHIPDEYQLIAHI